MREAKSEANDHVLASSNSEKGVGTQKQGSQSSKKRGRTTPTSKSTSSRKRKKINDIECNNKHPQIDAANQLSVEDFRSIYFPSNSPLRQYISDMKGANVQLYLHSVTSIPETALNACFSLIEDTSREAYKASQRGWKPRAKYREMREPDMKYVLVYRKDKSKPSEEHIRIDQDASDNAFVGFMSFQLTPEPPDQVLYIYEVHLAISVRGLGLGHYLMKIAQKIASDVGVAKTMLTVFTSNIKARKFYEKLGYRVDDISPDDRELRGIVRPADYAILSKGI